jgi:ATP-binding cassette subfamily B multidrug efflux pump
MKAFKTLKSDFVENRWRFLIGLLALLAVDVLQLLVPRIIKYAIDDLTFGVISGSSLVFYGAQILGVALLIGGLRYVWRQLLLGAARRIERSLRDRLFIHLQSLSFSYFSRTKVGDLMAHATNDVEAVRMSIAMGLVFLVDTVILGVLTIGFMIYIHPLLTLYAILPMPLITLITLFFSRLIHRRFEDVQTAFSSLTERIREAISGIRVVKAYVQEEKEKGKVSYLSWEYARKNVTVTKVWGMFLPVIMLFSNLSLVIVLYAGGRLTVLQSISTGDFVAFMSYLGILSWPMMALGWAINVVQRGAASMGRLNRIFEEVPEIADAGELASLAALRGEMEIKGLTFSARNAAAPLLQDICLHANQGEKIVVVGRTGAGKTIFCNLLTRILEAPEGSIFIDGTDIRRIPIHVLRRSVGYVPQDTFLFSDTIRENLIFGKLNATEQEIEGAARLAQVYDDIMEFPDGLDTVIGERGVTLSGGQRQRIAIARAVLMNPPILILDDALSSVDIQTEERILEGLEKFLQGRTSFLITHRIAPLRRADRIVVLEGGRVAEMGDHPTLLSRGGIYTEIYWRRQLEEELEREGVSRAS